MLLANKRKKGGNMTTNLGLAIRVEMAKKSLSLRQLEKLTGITIANLSKISSGKTKRPKIETIEKIAAGLGIEVQPLLEALRQDKLIDAQKTANALIHNSKGSIGQVVNFSNIEAKKFSVQTAEMPSKDASTESTRIESECVVVYGSAVLPEIKDGDTVYFNETEQINDNDFVVAEAEDTTDPVVRKVLKGENGDIWLLATNPDWPGEKKLKAKRILGVVTERRTRVPRG